MTETIFKKNIANLQRAVSITTSEPKPIIISISTSTELNITMKITIGAITTITTKDAISIKATIATKTLIGVLIASMLLGHTKGDSIA